MLNRNFYGKHLFFRSNRRRPGGGGQREGGAGGGAEKERGGKKIIWEEERVCAQEWIQVWRIYGSYGNILASYTGRGASETLDCKLHWYSKFYNNIILFVGWKLWVLSLMKFWLVNY